MTLRFRFVLAPLADVAPWGDPPHWFGQTDGWYWIEAGDHELPRYADLIPPYADYYVVRLWEDLLTLTPTVLRPVPDDLAAFVASDPDHWAPTDSDASLDAASWYGDHSLDFGYLRAAPRVRAWRTTDGDCDEVTLTWRHRQDAEIRWAGDDHGQVRIAPDEWLTAVRRLDRELMAAMDERITQLRRAARPGFDIGSLRREHEDRSTWLARRMASQPQEIDWDTVRTGAAELLSR